MKKTERWKEQMVSALEIPAGLAYSETIITMTGSMELLIENYRSISRSVSYTHLDVYKRQEQDPKVRATNFEEVCLGYNQEEAMEEAQRCLGCKKPKCVEGCPVSVSYTHLLRVFNMEETD